ncbi:hypothetical protein KP003_16595 [Geomonas nitrogeniifigens]|uniref:hypothetical protein n=1 Tax=Geomonas diazotrophica TaxID=2843197 RepID=UPI001C2C1E1B|nr:hypothetical protein [Geomonas nitrogeniifigens]QXE85960.1 hypothetical protein KP003_16595 [Geomonas nitrogeniifigens]
MQVAAVTEAYQGSEIVKMYPVCGQFGKDGESEDNTYARWSPSGSFELQITNPDLVGKIKPGQKFYIDFTEAE